MNANHPSKFEVDVVASRDLVRGFQRNLRNIVPVPASELAIDILDYNFNPNEEASKYLLERQQQVAREKQQNNQQLDNNQQHRHLQSEKDIEKALQQTEQKFQQQQYLIQQQQSQGKKVMSTYEKRRRGENVGSSPTSRYNNSTFYSTTAGYGYGSSSLPKSKSLHESLVESIKLDEEAKMTYNQKRELYQKLLLSQTANSQQRSTSVGGGGGGGRPRSGSISSQKSGGVRPRSGSVNSSFGISRVSSNMSSVWAKQSQYNLRSKAELAEERLKDAYKEHRRELKSKRNPPSKVVARARDEIVPVVLERELNSRMRHLGTSRCYYYDSWIQNEDGSPVRDLEFDYCDLNPGDEEAQRAAEREQQLQQQSKLSGTTPLAHIMSDEKLIRQRLNSGDFGPNLASILKKSALKNKKTKRSSSVDNDGSTDDDEDEDTDDEDDMKSLTSTARGDATDNAAAAAGKKNSSSHMNSPLLKPATVIPPVAAIPRRGSTAMTNFGSSKSLKNSEFGPNFGNSSFASAGSYSTNKSKPTTPSSIKRSHSGKSIKHQNQNQHHHFDHPELYGDGEGGRVMGLDPNRRPQQKVAKRTEAWSMYSHPSPTATEQLLRRQLAVTPPKPHSIPIPYQEKRRHVSPVASARKQQQQQQKVVRDSYFPTSTPIPYHSNDDSVAKKKSRMQWEMCYSVQ